jgi:tRNA (cmo5U34)-methyltransferase
MTSYATTPGESSLGHIPSGERWAFDESVSRVFPDMLERSIPQYGEMRRLTYLLAAPFVIDGTDIVDLGTARGDALAPFMDRFGARNRYTGVEVSAPMLAQAKARFASWPETTVRLLNLDLRNDYPAVDASVTLLVLTLMFIPVNYRAAILEAAYERTRHGGALVLVEKLVSPVAVFDKLFVARYHDLKAANGYSAEEIERKRLALEGVQVPLTERANIDLLYSAGFRYVETFWRWCNFAGFLAVR